MHISFISIGFLLTDLVIFVSEIDFAKNQADCYMQTQNHTYYSVSIFAHTSTTVIINMHISFISIGFLVADLVIFVSEIDFAKNQADCYMQTQNRTYYSVSIFCIHINNSYH